MEQAVVIGDFERVLPKDFNNFGNFPRQSIDHIVRDLGIPDAAFIGFNVSGDVGSSILNVSAGRLYFAGEDGTPVYFNADDGGVRLAIAKDLPVATLKRFLVYAYGSLTDGGGESRTFLTDPATRDTIAKPVSTISVRRAEIKIIGGQEGPDPVSPAIPTNSVVIARVLCDARGIVSIERATENVVPNIRDLDTARAENLTWRGRAGTRLDTLGGDITALAQRLEGTAADIFVREIAGDVARLKLATKLPASYTSYDADNFLYPAKSQTDHVDFLCQVKEGIRFGYANQSDQQIGLLNPIDPKVMGSNGFVLPAWDESVRVPCPTNDDEVSLSQYSFVNQEIVTLTKPVTRVQYGTPFQVCTNDVNWWQNVAVDYWNNAVIKDGISYQIVNQVAAPGPDHYVFRLQSVWTDTVQEPYWDLVTKTDVASGSIVSQSKLNTQDGWLCTVYLNFTKVAAAGDVTLLVTECTNASPDINRVITRQNIPVANLKPGINAIKIPPTMQKKGSRYGYFVITSGNHFMGITKNNKDPLGSMFVMSDGAFQVGSLTDDLCIGLGYCKFRAAYVEVDLQPLQLAGGIAAIDIWANMVITAGTSLVFYVNDPAVNQWEALDATSTGGGTALGGLPPLVKVKVAMIGTPDLMPGFDTSYTARMRCWRPRPDGRHISKVRTLPQACKNIQLKVRLEAWRGNAHHSYVPKVLTGPLLLTGVGDTITNFSTMSEIPAPDDPNNAVLRTYNFVLANASSTFRLREEINTDNVLTTFHVAERIDIDQP